MHAKFARCMRRMDSRPRVRTIWSAARRETGKIVWRETYTIAVSFAPLVADFGF